MQRSSMRLVLRRPQETDLQRLFEIYGDPITHQFNPFGPLVQIDEARILLKKWVEHWDNKGYGQWAIATRSNPNHIIGFGGIDAREYLSVKQVNLGYRFAPQAWGQGYATELSQAALVYGLDELALPEIFAVVRPDHSASISVLEKVGMHVAGELDDVPGGAPSLVFSARR